jgi:hypothetical protein
MAKKKQNVKSRTKKVPAKKKRTKKAGKAKRAPAKKAFKARDKIRNVGLDGRKFSKIKQEYHDIDYVDKLSDEEKEWLSRFMEEDLGARFNHPGKKVYRKKADRIASFRRNNARQRDMYSLAKATGLINDGEPGEAIEELQRQHYDAQDIENRLIDAIDAKKESSSEEPE